MTITMPDLDRGGFSATIRSDEAAASPIPCALTPWCDNEHGTPHPSAKWVDCRRLIGEMSLSGDTEIVSVSVGQEMPLEPWRLTASAAAPNQPGEVYVELYAGTDDGYEDTQLTIGQAETLAGVLKMIGEGRWMAEALTAAVAVIRNQSEAAR